MYECRICGLNRSEKPQGWCVPCLRAYDRHIELDDGTVDSVIDWAATRARKFDAARMRLKAAARRKTK